MRTTTLLELSTGNGLILKKSVSFISPIMLIPVAGFYNGVNCIGNDESIFAKILEDKGHRELRT